MTWLVVWSSLLFILGLLLGARLGIALEERAATRKRRERRAAQWLAGVRETRGGTVMPHRPPERARELPPLALDPVARRLFPETSAEEWRVYEDQALALASDEPAPYAWPAWSLLAASPPTFGEEIQAMIANANAVPSVRWLDRLEDGQ